MHEPSIVWNGFSSSPIMNVVIQGSIVHQANGLAADGTCAVLIK
jgi:hypothetical protein